MRWKYLNGWPKCAQAKHHYRRQSGSSGVNSTIITNTLMWGGVACCRARSISIQMASVTCFRVLALGWTLLLGLDHQSKAPWLECWSGSANDSPSLGSSIKLHAIQHWLMCTVQWNCLQCLVHLKRSKPLILVCHRWVCACHLDTIILLLPP